MRFSSVFSLLFLSKGQLWSRLLRVCVTVVGVGTVYLYVSGAKERGTRSIRKPGKMGTMG